MSHAAPRFGAENLRVLGTFPAGWRVTGGVVLVSILVGIGTVTSPMVALALVSCLVVVPFTFRFPEQVCYGVVAYAAFDQYTFLTWTVVNLGGFNVKPCDIGIALLTVALLHGVFSKRLKFPSRNWVLLALAGLMALSCFAVVRNLSTVGSMAIGVARYYIVFSILSVFLVLHGTKKLFLYRVVQTLVLAGCAGVAKDWLVWFGKLAGGDVSRMNPSSNMLVGAMCLVLAVALLLADKPKEIFPVFFTHKRWIIHASSIGLAVTIVFAAHRAVWLGTLTALSVVVLLARRKTLKQAVSIVGSLVVVVSLLLAADNVTGGHISNTLEGRLAFLHDVDSDKTGSWRLMLWERHVEEAMKNPILGNGFGKSPWVYHGSEGWKRFLAHNDYIMWFAHVGLIGLTLYLVFWVGVLIEGFRAFSRTKDRSVKYLAGVALAAVVGMMVFNLFYGITVLSWLFGGILLAIAYHRHGAVPSVAHGP